MNIFQQHERFEIEVLDLLQRSKILNPLVFGGGTMLRLCHELNRYSVDLDFWFLKDVQENDFLQLLQQSLQNHYEITDAHLKYSTLICEVRTSYFPKRLKIEVRRAHRDLDYQEKIAFSRFSTLQVLVKALTLEQSMHNKVAAFLDRGEIRDCFDIEFLLRRGVQLPALDKAALEKFKKMLQDFKPNDFKVKLGSIVEEDIRRYYISHGMAYLQEKIQAQLSF
ncbi:MAG: nucleotidyl transferase AbiEii/AbiGii toxin family protein [Desulfohalobiaceae bacterium]|nr:nucleotidyl transferase AbiEii/AbiGii toxin family protein [Desulfohalobiaceae bacterium]